MNNPRYLGFDAFALNPALLTALDHCGYTSPSPIQQQTIPLMLDGRDVVGQAQTGTGKTAAFALPMLSNLDPSQREPQILVLTPTRELAIQVAQAFKKYARDLGDFRVLPIYGGQDYTPQIRGLKRGAQVVVGTPGRVMDHLRRSTLDLSRLRGLVLDEADEMLTMGFIEDVQWILEQTPSSRQVALFSATMPAPIRRIANQHLDNPATVTIQVTRDAGKKIRQRFCTVRSHQKFDALARIAEIEDFDALLVFVRTKNATVDVADRLAARGYSAAALSGDVRQSMRERIVRAVKDGKLDVIVATDVAARGLDVERLSHVVNYDLPHDTEAYVHRIGRTGRAGRTGDAITFVTPRERRFLKGLERATQQPIDSMPLPSDQDIDLKRTERFDESIVRALGSPKCAALRSVVAEYARRTGRTPLDIAAALATMVPGEVPTPPLPSTAPSKPKRSLKPRDDGAPDEHDQPRAPRTKPRRPKRNAKPAQRSKKSHRHNRGGKNGKRAQR